MCYYLTPIESISYFFYYYYLNVIVLVVHSLKAILKCLLPAKA